MIYLFLFILSCTCAAQTINVAVFPASFPFLNTAPNNTQNNVTGFSFEVFDNVLYLMNSRYGYQIVPSYIYTNSVADFNNLLPVSEIGISGIAVTQDQLTQFGVSIPYRTSVIRAMVSQQSGTNHVVIYQIWQVIKSPAVLQYLLLFFLFCIPAAHVQWIIEHRKNADAYHKHYITGIGPSIYWAWITVTTVGYGDKVPKTLWGQVWTVIVLVIGIILINLVTGSISANLIINQLTPTPISLLDLSQTNVSVVRGSFAAELAQQVDAQLLAVDSIEDGLMLVQNGTAKFFLHEQASLLVQNQTSTNVFFAGTTLGDIQYSFLYPTNATLPATFYADLNSALLAVKGSANYTRLLQKYFTSVYTTTSAKKDYKDWIAVWVFAGIIFVYLFLLYLAFLIFARNYKMNDPKNPTKDEVDEPTDQQQGQQDQGQDEASDSEEGRAGR